MVLLIILIGVLCGALPTFLWWRERNLRINSQGWVKFYKGWMNKNANEVKKERSFKMKLARRTNITKNCKECGRFFKLTQADLLGRDIPEYCLEHKSMDIIRKHQSEGMRMQRDMLQQNLQGGQRRKLTGR